MAKKKLPARAKPVDRAGYLKQISDLQGMLTVQDDRTAEVEKHRDDLHSQVLQQRSRITALEVDNQAQEKRLIESRQHFGELKEQLYNAEIETARLRGLVERVHEQDRLRQPPVETHTVVTTPADHRPPTPDMHSLRRHLMVDRSVNTAAAEGRPHRHWLNW